MQQTGPKVIHRLSLASQESNKKESNLQDKKDEKRHKHKHKDKDRDKEGSSSNRGASGWYTHIVIIKVGTFLFLSQKAATVF